MALILLSNDDGIAADGLNCLEEALLGLGDIVVVAPDAERSAVSHGLTIRAPLELKKIDARHFSLTGTPADCVIFAITRVMDSVPDLVISGINHGANLGDDIMYSGTVAAAREASKRGVPAVAVSQAFDDSPINFTEGARFIRSLARQLLEKLPIPSTFLNVNFPVGRVRGVQLTRQGSSSYFPHFNVLDRIEEADGGRPVDEHVKLKKNLVFDYQAIAEGNISITPLERDQTDYSAARTFRDDYPQIFRNRRLPRMGLIS